MDDFRLFLQEQRVYQKQQATQMANLTEILAGLVVDDDEEEFLKMLEEISMKDDVGFEESEGSSSLVMGSRKTCLESQIYPFPLRTICQLQHPPPKITTEPATTFFFFCNPPNPPSSITTSNIRRTHQPLPSLTVGTPPSSSLSNHHHHLHQLRRALPSTIKPHRRSPNHSEPSPPISTEPPLRRCPHHHHHLRPPPFSTTITEAATFFFLSHSPSSIETTFGASPTTAEPTQPSLFLPLNTTFRKPPSPNHNHHHHQPHHHHRLLSLSSRATPLLSLTTTAESTSQHHQAFLNRRIYRPSLTHHHETTTLPLSKTTEPLTFHSHPPCSSSSPLSFSSVKLVIFIIRSQLGTSFAQNHLASVSPGELSVSLSTVFSTPPPIPIITGGILLSSIAGFFSFRMTRNAKTPTKGYASTVAGSTAGNLSQLLLCSCFRTRTVLSFKCGDAVLRAVL
ncbi:hypothetical protein PIB30_102109, partial [Stylosanthes scabra]|nr:hypothetical protein [Stylosanthes scabra]